MDAVYLAFNVNPYSEAENGNTRADQENAVLPGVNQDHSDSGTGDNRSADHHLQEPPGRKNSVCGDFYCGYFRCPLPRGDYAAARASKGIGRV